MVAHHKIFIFGKRVGAEIGRIIENNYVLWPDFLQLLVEEKDFTPERYDPDEEPPRYVFDPSNFTEPLELLMTPGESPLFERYNPYYMFW